MTVALQQSIQWAFFFSLKGLSILVKNYLATDISLFLDSQLCLLNLCLWIDLLKLSLNSKARKYWFYAVLFFFSSKMKVLFFCLFLFMGSYISICLLNFIWSMSIVTSARILKGLHGIFIKDLLGEGPAGTLTIASFHPWTPEIVLCLLSLLLFSSLHDTRWPRTHYTLQVSRLDYMFRLLVASGFNI